MSLKAVLSAGGAPAAPGRTRTPPETTRPSGFFLDFQREAIARAAAANQAIPRQRSLIAPPISSPARSAQTMGAAVTAGNRARAEASGGKY